MLVEGRVLFQHSAYPIGELACQLQEWSLLVSDESRPVCFVFQSDAREFHGTFRIEPRPELWEFTSWKELRRPRRLLELSVYRSMAREFFMTLSQAGRDFSGPS